MDKLGPCQEDEQACEGHTQDGDQVLSSLVVLALVRSLFSFRFDDLGALGLDRVERRVNSFYPLVRDQFGELQGRQRL